MRTQLSDGTGWVNLDGAKRYAGMGEELFHTFGGSWIIRDGDGRYQRINLATAHAWLVNSGYYPARLGEGFTAL